MLLMPATCAVQQFIGGLVGKITGLIDSLIGPLLNPIQSILNASFNVKQAIFGGLNMMKKLVVYSVVMRNHLQMQPVNM